MSSISYVTQIYGSCKNCGKEIVLHGTPGGKYSVKNVIKVKGKYKIHACDSNDVKLHKSKKNIAKSRMKKNKESKVTILYVRGGNTSLDSLPSLPASLKYTSQRQPLKPTKRLIYA